MARRSVCPAHAELKTMMVDIKAIATEARDVGHAAARRVERAAIALAAVAATVVGISSFLYQHREAVATVAGNLTRPSAAAAAPTR